MEKFEDMIGKTLVGIEGSVGGEEMVFITTDGEKCILYYEHD